MISSTTSKSITLSGSTESKNANGKLINDDKASEKYWWKHFEKISSDELPHVPLTTPLLPLAQHVDVTG